ncbi:MAG: EamA-like transporter family protein [Methanosaeta sp. PtaB.Bin039]|nr:MAG: EamA-like transporter family protein [Methanosaeta sp. PtaB.Bin039]
MVQSWLVLALGATSSFAAAGILDRVLVRRFQSSASYLVALIIFQQIFNLGLIAWQGLHLTIPWSLWAAAAGVLQLVLWAAYVKALQVEEVSRVTALVFVYPLLTLLGSVLFLGESLTLAKAAGGIALVLSAVLISYRRSSSSASPFSPALKYLAVFWISVSVYSLTSKHLLQFMDEWQLVIWSSFGNLAILSLLFIPGVRGEVAGFVSQGRSGVATLLLEEALDLFGRAGMIFAYAAGSVYLVSAVSALQPLIVLIYVLLIGRILPDLLEEETEGPALATKLCAVVMVAAGLYLVT